MSRSICMGCLSCARRAPLRVSKTSTVFFQGVFLRAVCCSGAPAGPVLPPAARCLPWLAGSKTLCGTAPGREAAGCCGICVFLPPCAAEPMRRERVSRLRSAPSAARPGLDAGATGALHCAALEGGRTTPQQPAALRSAARGRASATSRQARLASGVSRAGLGLQGPQHTARPVKDPSTYRQERSEPQSPPGGMGGRGSSGTGRAQRRRCLPCAPPGGRRSGGKAQRLFERVAAPTGGQNVAWQPSASAGAVQRGDGVSAAALTGPPAAAQTGVPFRPARARAIAVGHRAPPAAGSPTRAAPGRWPGHTAAAVTTQARVLSTRSYPHALGKRGRTSR